MSTKKYISALTRYLTNPDYRFLMNAGFGKYDKMPDKEYLERKFECCMGKPLDLENPQTFNEKLQWLKLYDRKPEYTIMVDKYKVREYIKEKIGEEYLIPLIGVWNKPDDIDFETLPNQFVLKCNHNSGLGMYICKDKSKLTSKGIETIRKNLAKGLAQDYYLTGREWPYKDVPRKIICEKYMEETGKLSINAKQHGGLDDYKIHSFNGEPRAILVCRDRFSELGMTEDFFDENWTHLAVQREKNLNSGETVSRPKELGEMLKLAKILSKNMPFLRSDFYTIGGKVYFGELTFFPASGFEKFVPESFDKELGDRLSLPCEG